jgi:nicotinate phosphoribosyltransferase
MIAAPSKCVEFGLRRAQGPSAAMIASKYSYLGGFEGSSNVYGGFLSGIPCMGTMAHSFIMSFEKVSDIDESKMLGDVDLLVECLKVREELGWT